MNEIVNKFLLSGDTFMPKMHLKEPGLLIVLVSYLLKIKNEIKTLKKQDMKDISMEMNWIILFST